jgi:hypothetical protein
MRIGAAVLAMLQILPLLRGGLRRREAGPLPAALRRVLAALVLSTSVLVLVAVALVWYGSTYLVRPPHGAFVRGPYLTAVSRHGASFDWKLAAGQGPLTLDVLAPDGSVRRAVDGVVDGLRPGTRYVWTANVAGSSAAVGSLRTAPISNATPTTLVAFGDYGSGNAHEYAVARLAAAAQPALFLSAGDNAYLLAAPPLLDRALFTPLRPLLAVAAPVVALGEHDLAWNDGSAVISALHLPGHRYAVQYGPIQVVVLGLQADASGLAFARARLGRCASPCPLRFVLAHRPIAADNPILPLLRRRRVAAIVVGHLHRYERHLRDGIPQFTVGTGGEGPGSAQFTRPTPDALVSFIAYGFLRIDVAGRHVEYRFVDESGHVRDRLVQRLTCAQAGCAAMSAASRRSS